MQGRHRFLCGLLGQQFLHPDQVVLALRRRVEPVCVRLDQTLPRRVVGEVVVGVRPEEGDQIGDRLEAVEVLVLAEQCLPLVAGIAPAWSPECVQVALGQSEPDLLDVSSHAAQPRGGCPGVHIAKRCAAKGGYLPGRFITVTRVHRWAHRSRGGDHGGGSSRRSRPGLHYLTEGGQETEIMYKYGFDLPHFAMFPLLDNPRAMAELRGMYSRYLDIAARNGFGVVVGGLDYRASPDWGSLLGYSRESLAEMQLRAIDFLREVAQPYAGQVPALDVRRHRRSTRRRLRGRTGRSPPRRQRSTTANSSPRWPVPAWTWSRR